MTSLSMTFSTQIQTFSYEECTKSKGHSSTCKASTLSTGNVDMKLNPKQLKTNWLAPLCINMLDVGKPLRISVDPCFSRAFPLNGETCFHLVKK